MTQEEPLFETCLERKANAFFGFVVPQSILLANNLTHGEFMKKVQMSAILYKYIMIAHVNYYNFQ